MILDTKFGGLGVVLDNFDIDFTFKNLHFAKWVTTPETLGPFSAMLIIDRRLYGSLLTKLPYADYVCRDASQFSVV